MVACSGVTEPASPDPTSVANPTSSPVPESDNPWWVGDDKITLKALGHISSLYVDVKDYNEILGIQEFSKKTNLYFEWEMTNDENEKEQINLSFASKKMPDIFTHFLSVNAVKYGSQGALIDLLPLIKEHGPNIMKALEADPVTLPLYTTAEGNLYMIPQIDEDYRLSSFKTMVIQKAWLDKLDLKVPTTPDEFYIVLKAFKDHASELTSEKIIPYTSYFSGGIEGWFNTFSWAFGMYGAKGYEKDGKIVFGAFEPEFRETMAFIQKLYSEGLIDEDLDANKDDPTFEAKMTNNRVGIAYVGQGRIGTYNQKAGATFDAYEFIPMIPLEDKEGQVRYGGVGPLAHNTPAMSISINNEYPAETIKAWDWFFSDEGKTMMNLGIEGDTFNKVDGKVIYTDKIMKDPNLNANQALLKYISPLYEWPCARIYDFERAQLGPVLAEYKDNMQSLGALDGVKTFALNTLPISEEQVKNFATLEADVNTFVDESLVKFIRGDWNLEADYDSFNAQLKSMNIDEYISTLNEGYAKLTE